MDTTTLETARTNLIASLAADSVNPKPNYSIGNRSVSWDSWRDHLLDEIEKLTDLIIRLNPYEIVTRRVL